MKATAKDLERAIIFATKAHENQVRKGDGRPYILHPLEVMFILSSIKKSTNPYLIAICCLLHDTVEDCDVTLEDIRIEYGYHVAAIIDELTSDAVEIEKMGKTEYLCNKMVNMSSYSLRIKLADRLHNLRDKTGMSADFAIKYKNQTEIIIDRLILHRKLTATHLKLIRLITKELNKIK